MDYKLLQIHQRLSESSKKMLDFHLAALNDSLAENNVDRQYTSLYDTLFVSNNAAEKIKKIINEDKKRLNYFRVY